MQEIHKNLILYAKKAKLLIIATDNDREGENIGFEIIEEIDLVKTADVSWYEPIDPDRSWRPWRDFWSFKTTRWGRGITHYLVWALETLRIAPKGTMSVSSFLKKGADGLVAGGKKGIYTVMYFTVARKPPTKSAKPLPSPKKAPAAAAAQ